MPERPLVLFGKPEDAERNKKRLSISPPHLPSYARQKERLGPQLQALQGILDKGALTLQDTADGIDPEYTLVLEAYGDHKGFHSAVRNLQSSYPEVELLFETDLEDVLPDEDFYYTTKQNQRDENKVLTFKCFCVLTNQKALQEILRLWSNYDKDRYFTFQHGKTGLKNIFDSLKTIHLWGIEERFEETKAKEAWENDLTDPSIQNIKCEIELSYRRFDEKRMIAERKIESEISRIGGRVLAKSCITTISYHAILVEIPRKAAHDILSNPNVSFLVFNEILFINPSGQTVVTASEEAFNFEGTLQYPDSIRDDPILALFDGLPQENHPLLKGFLIIDDPDDYTSSYEIKDRQHGTAMTSLITWGELSNHSLAISRKIYIRPIMKPRIDFDDKTNEYIPDDVLLVDKIHIAVRRLFEAQDGQSIPSIKIINLSIGISNRPFFNLVSPLAKLLDWLSFKYKVLFIISAGNYNDDIDLGISFSDFSKLSNDQKDEIIVKAINARKRNQKLLSPAESMNSLTVGALFSDHSNYTPIWNELIPCSNRMPSPISALGRGINHSIKPDLLLEGGRNIVNEDFIRHNIAHWGISPRTRPPGILHAKPVFASDGNRVGYTYGTSNSTAIFSHNAIHCYDVLDDLFMVETGYGIPAEYASLLLKAMLVHGAKWDETATFIGKTLDMPSRKNYSDKIHKFIGYGVPDIEKVKECTKNCITLIGYGELEKEAAHLYTIPLSIDFSTIKILRELTVTLAYFTPIAPNLKKYRQVNVWFTVDDNKGLVKNRFDADTNAVKRGTIQHERLYGDNAVPWSPDDTLTIKVNCREDAGYLSDRIPYAIFITFEIAPEYDIDVYAIVLERIRLRTKLIASVRQ
jgi:hypothetical protein